MKGNKCLRLLTYVTGLVNQELLLQNEYLAAENRILRATSQRDCVCLIRRGPPSPKSANTSDAKQLAQVARVAKPDTILALYRRLIAYKFDGSKHRKYSGAHESGPPFRR